MNKPELDFVKPDVEELETNTLNFLEAALGRKIYPADPLRLVVKSFLAIIVNQQLLIDTIAKQNLLAFATGKYLDALGQLVGVSRLEASSATTTVEVRLSAARQQPTTIAKGTRVTADNQIFFALDDELIFMTGETIKTAKATCLTVGAAGNGFAAGELNKIVDPQPFLMSIVNTTTSEGGADTEDDESLRERIHIAPESFSCAGSSGAYIARTKEVSALISDVAVMSPAPGVVNVYVLCEGGQLPGAEIISAVEEHLNDKTVRPLTDTVNVLSPEPVSYDIDLTAYISVEDKGNAAQIIAACNAATEEYVTYQSARIGRDVNPSKLIGLLMSAGAKRVEVREPSFTVLGDTQVAVCASRSIRFDYEDD